MAASTSSIRTHDDLEEAIEHLYDVTILGKTILTTVTKYNEGVTQWIDAVNSDDNPVNRRVGFEVELYNRNDTTRIGTAQFCVGNRCLVIQVLNPWSYPIALYKFLVDRNNTFIGVDILSKMKTMEKHYSFELVGVPCTDLGAVAAERFDRPELINADQSELGEAVLGVVDMMEMEIQKPVVDHSDWGRNTKLSDEQVQYACIDAFFNLEIGNGLL